MTLPRRFHLDRDVDATGVSGTGHVADGIRWRDGTASVIWLSPRPSIAFWYRIGEGVTDAEWVHSHGGTADTRLVWDDPEPSPGPDAECGPECVERHTYRLGECALSCTEMHGSVAHPSWSVRCPNGRCQAPADRPCRRTDGSASSVVCEERAMAEWNERSGPGDDLRDRPAEAQQDTVRTAPDTTRTPDGPTAGQSRTPQVDEPGQQDTAPPAEQDTSDHETRDLIGVLLSRVRRGVQSHGEADLLVHHVEHLLLRLDQTTAGRATWRASAEEMERDRDRLATELERTNAVTAATKRLMQRRTTTLRERAEQAEELQRIAHRTSNQSEAARAEAASRAERAEAALVRVCALRDPIAEALEQADYRMDMQRGDLADSVMPVILDAMRPTPPAAVHPSTEQQASGEDGPAAGRCERHPVAPVIGGTCSGCIVDPADKP